MKADARWTLRAERGAVLVGAALFVSACGCDNKPGVNRVEPTLEVVVDGNTALADSGVIDFGTVKIQDPNPATHTLTLKNLGRAPLNLDGDPTIEGSPDFSFVRQGGRALVPCGSGLTATTIGSGDCATATVQYVPGELGPDEATLTVRSDDANRPVFTARLVGRGGSGDIEVCVASVVGPDLGVPLDLCSSSTQKELVIDFGGVLKGAGNLTRRVHITNTGDLPVSVFRVATMPGDPIDFEVSPSDFSGSLNKGDAKDFLILFTPQDVGPRAATGLVDNDTPGENPVLLKLRASGDAPKLVLSADATKGCNDAMPALDFGDVAVGQAVVKPVTVLSCGTRAVQLTSISLDASGSPDFTIDRPPSAAPLPPGSKTSMDIRYQPASIGPDSTKLRAASTDLITPIQFMNITGKGTLPPECKIELSVTSIDFGSVMQASTVVRSVTLHNAGGIDCKLNRVAIDAGGAGVRFLVQSAPIVPYTLPANGLVDVKVGYQPADATGPDQGQLLIDSTDTLRFPGGQIQLPLKGTPTPRPECHLEILPAKPTAGDRLLNFGTVGIGDTKDMDVTLKNTGGADCNISSTQFGTYTNGSVFSVKAAVPALPSRIAVGQSQTVTVRFAPTSTGTYYASSNFILVHTDAVEASECTTGTPTNSTQGCKKVGLQATGDRIAIDPVPKALDFGLVTVGCNSAEQTVTVYNTGNATVTVSAIAVSPAGSPFVITSQPALPYSLAPSGSFPLRVKYRPPDANTHNAVLTITHSAGTTTVSLKGTGSLDKHQVDTFTQLSQPKTDILFVMDDSCSMYDKQQYIASNASTFVNTASATSNDFQLGVVTTDVNYQHNAGCWGGCTLPWNGMPISPGVLWYQPKIVIRSTPNYATAFSNNLRPGTNGSGMEKGLEAAKLALSNPLISDPTKNLGMIRTDAKLVVIVVSDEDDSSPTTNVQYYVDFYYSIKGARNSQLFAFHAIVGDSPGGCSGNGTASAGTRYIEVAKRTNGLFRSICSTDWGRIARDIGLDAFAARTQFFLTRTADVNTLSCKVNGVLQTRGTQYTYDAATNSVIFAATAVPAAGSTILCEYDTLCL